MISEEKIEQFRVLFRNRFGKEIGKQEACEIGMRLVTLLKATLKPIKD